jgi:hypothetical protein
VPRSSLRDRVEDVLVTREAGTEGREWRILTFAAVLIFPIVSFPLGALAGPDWQSGGVLDRLAVLLHPEVSLVFAPFIIVAWVATMAVILFERFLERFRLVRLAVYSAVPLTIQYLVLSSLALAGAPIVITPILLGGGAVVVAIARLLDRRWRIRAGLIVGGLIVVTVVGGAIDIPLTDGLGLIVAVLALSLLIAGPGICAVISVHRSWRLANRAHHRRVEDGLGSVPGDLTSLGISAAVAVPWVGAYLWTWRRATTRAIEIYEALPTEPPGCFVATAAARGHPRLVGSWSVRSPAGQTFAITRQLQNLKVAELALAAGAPGLHRLLRLVYNRIGPALSARIAPSALRADLAYVALKPIEAVLWCLVAAAGPEARSAARRVYRATGPRPRS